MKKMLTIIFLLISFTCLSQDKAAIPQDSLQYFYNKTIMNTLNDSLRQKQFEKYGFILIQTDFDTTLLVKKIGDIKFRYLNSKTSILSVLNKPYKKHLDQTIYIINHFIINQDTIDVNIGRRTIINVDKKMFFLRAECSGAMGYIPTGRFIYDRALNNWTFTPGSVFINQYLEAMKKRLNKD